LYFKPPPFSSLSGSVSQQAVPSIPQTLNGCPPALYVVDHS
jgi:hypothetical protein